VDGVVATRLEVDGSRYTGNVDGELCYGREKAERVRSLARGMDLDLSRSFAYSDSASDIPLLEMVGHPVAVNPDAALLAEASAWNWKVLRLRPAPRRRVVEEEAFEETGG
jgi:phosphoserine phosphatase